MWSFTVKSSFEIHDINHIRRAWSLTCSLVHVNLKVCTSHFFLSQYFVVAILLLECAWNVMAHAQKPDFVFPRNGRVHLNQQGASVQSTAGSRGVGISGSNAGYTMFRGSVKSTGYPLHSSVSLSFPLSCVTVCHHISTEVYLKVKLCVCVCVCCLKIYPINAINNKINPERCRLFISLFSVIYFCVRKENPWMFLFGVKILSMCGCKSLSIFIVRQLLES